MFYKKLGIVNLLLITWCFSTAYIWHVFGDITKEWFYWPMCVTSAVSLFSLFVSIMYFISHE